MRSKDKHNYFPDLRPVQRVHAGLDYLMMAFIRILRKL